jgi:hypothetical protein
MQKHQTNLLQIQIDLIPLENSQKQSSLIQTSKTKKTIKQRTKETKITRNQKTKLKVTKLLSSKIQNFHRRD